MPIIREEFNARLPRVELPDKSYKALVAPFETKFDALARECRSPTAPAPTARGRS